MPQVNQSLFEINGVIDTNKSVLSNINEIANACSSWVTYDTTQGKWAVIINGAITETVEGLRTPKSMSVSGPLTSQAQYKIGSGSLAFDGVNDYVSANSSEFAFGANSHTVEMWIRRNSNTSGEWLYDFRTGVGTSASYLYASGTSLVYGTINTIRITASGALPLANVWYHVAMVKDGQVTKLYVNGIQQGSSYTDSSPHEGTLVKLGARYDLGSNFLAGYMDEVRISNTARYLTAFTPQETPFVSDDNTLMLLHLDTSVSDDNFVSIVDASRRYDADNIIGGVNVSSTGLTELYNDVQVQFTHKDLLDNPDVISYSIPAGSRFANEFDNSLNFQVNLVNDPVQAEILALRELKQSRVNTVIEFRTDYSSLGVKAGDIITLDSSVIGISDLGDKYFRVITVSEEDSDDNNLIIAITALEYDADVYSTAGVTRLQRSPQTGIISKYLNTAAVTSDGEQTVESTNTGLLGPLGATLAARLLNSLFTPTTVASTMIPKGFQISATAGNHVETNLAATTTAFVEFHTYAFIPTYSGEYLGQIIFDQNGSGAVGLDDDIVAFKVALFNGAGTQIATENSGGGGTWFWNDYLLSFGVPLTANETYTLKFSYINATVAGSTMGVTASWNLFSTGT